MRLERAARLLEERFLFRRRGAAQQRVAVREAPKALDYIAVRLGIAREFLISEGADELHRAVLVGNRLTVLKGQIEEDAPLDGQPLVETDSDRQLGDGARQPVIS